MERDKCIQALHDSSIHRNHIYAPSFFVLPYFPPLNCGHSKPLYNASVRITTEPTGYLYARVENQQGQVDFQLLIE